MTASIARREFIAALGGAAALAARGAGAAASAASVPLVFSSTADNLSQRGRIPQRAEQNRLREGQNVSIGISLAGWPVPAPAVVS